MNTLRHPVAAFLLFAVMIVLVTTVYNGIKTNYGIVSDDVDSAGLTIGEKLSNLNIITTISDISNALNKLSSTKLSITNAPDILGNLASLGIGLIKVVGSIITFPVEIIGIITDFYQLPPIISTLVGLMFSVYIGFKILSLYIKDDV